MISIGIVGLMNCLRKEQGCSNARYFFIQNESVPSFTQNSPFFENQLNQQLTANILRNGQWGSMRHLTLGDQINTTTKVVENAFINTIITGNLKSTKWIESPLRYYMPKNDEISNLCYVYYSGLNFRYQIVMQWSK